MDIFIEISLIIAITMVITWLTHWLRQPLIMGYIVAGILSGPVFLNLVNSQETLETFAHIGIALLLFTVGLNLNPKIIKNLGKISLITGLGQFIFTSLLGFGISIALGFPVITSIYIAGALAFSSTIIILKLLADKNDTETLYGRISTGILLVQDLIVILALIVISSIASGNDLTNIALNVPFKDLGLITALILIGIYVIPRILKTIARSQEFLLLFAFGWCLMLASIFYYFGFSLEVGALFAGITIAMSPYRFEIHAKMKPLRDFFIIIFFILLGSQMIFTDINLFIVPIIIFSIFVLVGNPLIVMIMLGLLGYTKRTGFLVGLTVAQISEFSLILIALGVSFGHVKDEILPLVIIIGLITIAGSSYLILYAEKIYPHFSKALSVFEKKGKRVDEKKSHDNKPYDTILFGYNRIGFDIFKTLNENKISILIIDYNPETIDQLKKLGVHYQYGDASDSELLESLNLKDVRLVISTIPDTETNLLLIKEIKAVNQKAKIITISHNIDESLELYKEGAFYVIMPHFLSGHHLSAIFKKQGLSLEKMMKEKSEHIKYLKMRKTAGQEHPHRESL